MRAFAEPPYVPRVLGSQDPPGPVGVAYNTLTHSFITANVTLSTTLQEYNLCFFLRYTTVNNPSLTWNSLVTELSKSVVAAYR